MTTTPEPSKSAGNLPVANDADIECFRDCTQAYARHLANGGHFSIPEESRRIAAHRESAVALYALTYFSMNTDKSETPTDSASEFADDPGIHDMREKPLVIQFPGDLRDWFAGQALASALTTSLWSDKMAKTAYQIADSMLAERRSRQ